MLLDNIYAAHICPTIGAWFVIFDVCGIERKLPVEAFIAATFDVSL